MMVSEYRNVWTDGKCADITVSHAVANGDNENTPILGNVSIKLDGQRNSKTVNLKRLYNNQGLQQVNSMYFVWNDNLLAEKK
jgi:hypothetical protein